MSGPCLCFSLVGCKPKLERSRVVWTQHGSNPTGWYTVHGDSYIYYGTNKEHAEEQSDAMNDYLAHKLFNEQTFAVE